MHYYYEFYYFLCDTVGVFLGKHLLAAGIFLVFCFIATFIGMLCAVENIKI